MGAVAHGAGATVCVVLHLVSDGRPLGIQCDRTAICRHKVFYRSLISIIRALSVCPGVPAIELITDTLKRICGKVLCHIVGMGAGCGMTGKAQIRRTLYDADIGIGCRSAAGVHIEAQPILAGCSRCKGSNTASEALGNGAVVFAIKHQVHFADCAPCLIYLASEGVLLPCFQIHTASRITVAVTASIGGHSNHTIGDTVGNITGRGACEVFQVGNQVETVIVVNLVSIGFPLCSQGAITCALGIGCTTHGAVGAFICGHGQSPTEESMTFPHRICNGLCCLVIQSEGAVACTVVPSAAVRINRQGVTLDRRVGSILYICKDIDNAVRITGRRSRVAAVIIRPILPGVTFRNICADLHSRSRIVGIGLARDSRTGCSRLADATDTSTRRQGNSILLTVDTHLCSLGSSNGISCRAGFQIGSIWRTAPTREGISVIVVLTDNSFPVAPGTIILLVAHLHDLQIAIGSCIILRVISHITSYRGDSRAASIRLGVPSVGTSFQGVGILGGCITSRQCGVIGRCRAVRNILVGFQRCAVIVFPGDCEEIANVVQIDHLRSVCLDFRRCHMGAASVRCTIAVSKASIAFCQIRQG